MAPITALGFAIGAAVHATAFLLIGAGILLYGPTYPAWRHVLMAAADGAISWIGFRHPAWLFVALPTWVAEQLVVNGFGVVSAVVIAAIVALAWERTHV